MSVLASGHCLSWVDGDVETNSVAAAGGSATWVMTIVPGRLYCLSSYVGATDMEIFLPASATNGVRWNFAWGNFLFEASTGQVLLKVDNHHATAARDVTLIELS